MRLRQSIVQSQTRDNDSTFSLATWVGTIGGAALSTDPSPNVTPPSNGRIVQMSPKKGAMLSHGSGALRYVCGVVAASSITVQPWFFDNTLNTWVPFGPTVTITPTGGAAVNTTTTTTLNMGGAKFFVQITANTLVQALGYDVG